MLRGFSKPAPKSSSTSKLETRKSLPNIKFTKKHFSSPTETKPTFDVAILDMVVCPLTKTKLRYDQTLNELICDELAIAYPVRNGIPYLMPQMARQLQSLQEKVENKTK